MCTQLHLELGETEHSEWSYYANGPIDSDYYANGPNTLILLFIHPFPTEWLPTCQVRHKGTELHQRSREGSRAIQGDSTVYGKGAWGFTVLSGSEGGRCWVSPEKISGESTP